MKLPIYMDNPSTTRLDDRVLEAMMPYFTEVYGHAASRNHEFGWDAEKAVDAAREQIAELTGAMPKEIIFTSGGTESNNLAIKGVASMYKEKGNHIITCSIDQKAILDPCKRLEREGYQVTYLPVDRYGVINPDEIEAAITDDTILITTMLANNEIGTIQPITAIGQIAKKRKVVFHVDAVHAAGKIPIDVNEMGIDLLSLTGHLVYGPKGIGALYVRRKRPRVRLTPIFEGGGHERGLRSGTINVPGAVGFGKACELSLEVMESEAERLRAMRGRLEGNILSRNEEVFVNGHVEQRLPGICNISFAYIEGEGMMMAIKEIAVASGSACTSSSLEPSHVLKGLGVGEDLAHTSIRFGLGRYNTEEEVDYTADLVHEAVNKLREMSPLYEMAMEGIDITAIEWPED